MSRVRKKPFITLNRQISGKNIKISSKFLKKLKKIHKDLPDEFIKNLYARPITSQGKKYIRYQIPIDTINSFTWGTRAKCNDTLWETMFKKLEISFSDADEKINELIRNKKK